MARQVLFKIIKKQIKNEKLTLIEKIKTYLKFKDDKILKIIIGYLYERIGNNIEAIKMYEDVIKESNNNYIQRCNF